MFVCDHSTSTAHGRCIIFVVHVLTTTKCLNDMFNALTNHVSVINLLLIDKEKMFVEMTNKYIYIYVHNILIHVVMTHDRITTYIRMVNFYLLLKKRVCWITWCMRL